MEEEDHVSGSTPLTMSPASRGEMEQVEHLGKPSKHLVDEQSEEEDNGEEEEEEDEEKEEETYTHHKDKYSHNDMESCEPWLDDKLPCVLEESFSHGEEEEDTMIAPLSEVDGADDKTGAPFTESMGPDVAPFESMGTDVHLFESMGPEVSVFESMCADVPLFESMGTDVPLFESKGAEVPLFEFTGGDAPLSEPMGTDVPLSESMCADAPLSEPMGTDVPLPESMCADAPLSEAKGQVPLSEPERKGSDSKTGFVNEEKPFKKANSFKSVRFQEPCVAEEAEETFFPEYDVEEWTSSSFEEMFFSEDWEDITDDRLLRKRVLEPGPLEAPYPAWGQLVVVKMHGILEDRTVVEKDSNLQFVIGEGDANQALEECVLSMQRGEMAMLLADSLYTYGHLGREPDIPPWAALLYQLQLLEIREKPDPLTLTVADRIRIGNQKRERGNFHFQREEFTDATKAYRMALDVLTTSCRRHSDNGGTLEEEEVKEYRVKCLNNLAASQLKLEQWSEALHTSRDVLFLDPNNVKALFRTGKLLSDRGEYEEAMVTLKKALKLEPSTKAIHVELSKLVRRQSGGKATEKWKAKPAQFLGENIAPFLAPSKKQPPGHSWKFLLGALVVALGSLVTSVVLTARN